MPSRVAHADEGIRTPTSSRSDALEAPASTSSATSAPARYRTIVADPPWDVGRFIGGFGGNVERRREVVAERGENVELDYPTMSVDEICDLPVMDLCHRDGGHLYLWTTTQYLLSADLVARAWGFTPTATLVWCKPSGGFGGGAFYPNVEFVLFCRRGRCPTNSKSTSRWFQWPRAAHSVKPEGFLDLVERVSPGPYLELFARRQRLGWDTWGNEALEHVEVARDA